MELKYFADIAGRAALVVIFGVLATAKFIAIASLLRMAKIDWLELATQIANLAFVFLVVCMAIIRVKPLRGSDGWEARLSALAGSSLPLLLLALPVANLGSGARMASLSLIAVGWVLSVYALMWLGRSFSIMPQARRLVTTGPYGIVRHPLYLSEEIAVLGVMGLYLSPAALAIVAVHWAFQLRRMANEEKVLLATFRDYSVYAENTPKVFPYYFSKFKHNA
jgi:protein-S-isoprenylcysteine O-methyltransferase Ste14